MQMPKREGWYLCELAPNSVWRGCHDRPFTVCRAKIMHDVYGTKRMMWEGVTEHSVVAWHVLPKATVNRGQ